jgi:hypothetical protein
MFAEQNSLLRKRNMMTICQDDESGAETVF